MRQWTPASKMRSLTAAVACLGAIALACGGGKTNDAAARDGDDADGGMIDDADAAGSEDAGVAVEAGICGCSYGFHHECGSGEICANSYLEAPTCTRALPRGGAAAGACSAASGSGACNAQCVTSALNASVCRDTELGIAPYVIDDWLLAINRAVESGAPGGWASVRAEDIPTTTGETISQECLDFLGWTVLGLVELCRGSDTVIHGTQWEQFEGRLFKVMSRPQDDCTLIAGNTCISALRDGVDFGGELAADQVDQIPGYCPNGLPYGPPCGGADAQACVKARVATIIRALHRQ